MSNISSSFKHQQQGVSLRTFAEQSGISEKQLLFYAKKGRILGARKHPLTKKWWIYPPAKLLFPDSSSTYTRRQQAPQEYAAAVENLRDMLPGTDGFDFGTSPHGLSAMHTPSVQTTPGTVALPVSCRPLLILGLPPDSMPFAVESEAHGEGLGGEAPAELPNLLAEPEDLDELPDWVSPGALPDVFSAPEVQEAMRCIRKAAGETHYPLVLSGSQMQLMERAVGLAIDEAIDAMSDEPTGRHEIKPCLDACNQLYRILRAAKAAHKTANEDWRGMEL